MLLVVELDRLDSGLFRHAGGQPIAGRCCNAAYLKCITLESLQDCWRNSGARLQRCGWFRTVVTRTDRAALVLGSIPMLVGLAIVLPILGHSTWHLYRIAVEPDQGERPEYRPKRKGIRYAADFPASLFARSERPDDELH